MSNKTVKRRDWLLGREFTRVVIVVDEVKERARAIQLRR
jgi:hypothetical protein